MPITIGKYADGRENSAVFGEVGEIGALEGVGGEDVFAVEPLNDDVEVA